MIAGVFRSNTDNPGALFNAALLAGFQGHTEKEKLVSRPGLARVLYREGDIEGTLQRLDRAITLDPEQLYGYILRAGVRDNLDIHPGALEDYSEALERRPGGR